MKQRGALYDKGRQPFVSNLVVNGTGQPFQSARDTAPRGRDASLNAT